MTITIMKEIAKQNNGTIPAGVAMDMTDFEISKAIKHGLLKEAPQKVQSLESKKETKKESGKTSEKKASKKASTENKKADNSGVMNPPAPEFSKEQKSLYHKLDEMIYDRMNDMQKSSFDIAYAIHSIYTNNYYKIDGYKNVYDYARERYGISRGTTNNFINIVERFCILEKSVFELKPEFSGYSSTQLICMLGHTDEELEEKKIEPKMSSREIKKALKTDSGNNDAKGEAVNSINGGKSDDSRTKGNKPDDKGTDADSLNEVCANVIFEICKADLPASCKEVSGTPENLEKYISEALAEKVKIICKLLSLGRSIQILEIL